MSIDKPNPIISNDSIRQISSDLFSQLKEPCVELTNLTLTAQFIQSPKLPKLLGTISEILESHQKQYSSPEGPYVISTNLADYIFFPLTSLLKQNSLDDTLVRHLLSILGFLIRHAWSYQINITLIDQLYPLILFLSGCGPSTTKTNIESKTLEFKTAAVHNISSLIDCVPHGYFQEKVKTNRLTFLGNSVTVLLDVLSSITNPTSPEETSLVSLTVSSLDHIIRHSTTSEQLSHILPGIASQTIAFITTSSNLHFSLIVSFIQLLEVLIVKVFNDKDLNINEIDNKTKAQNLEEINELWENGTFQQSKEVSVSFKIPDSSSQRSISWVKATSKQLKLSLTVLFKYLLVTSQVNKLKLQSKPKVAESIIQLFKSLLENCLVSLYNEVIPLGLDVLSLLISVSSLESPEDEMSKIHEITRLVCDSQGSIESRDKHVQLLFALIKVKSEDLIDSRMTSIVFSVDEEKINSFLIAIKLHLNILNVLSKNLGNQEDQIAVLYSRLLKSLKELLIESYHFNTTKSTKPEDNFRQLQGELVDNEAAVEHNRLDNIELPPTINAKYVTKFRQDPVSGRASSSSSLMILSERFSDIDRMMQRESNDLSSGFLSRVYTSSTEKKFENLVTFVGSLIPKDSNGITTFEKLFDIDINDEVLTPGLEKNKPNFSSIVSLWMANNLLSNRRRKSEKEFDIDEFLVFDEPENNKSLQVYADNESQEDLEEVSYLILSKSQEQIAHITDLMNTSKMYTNEEVQIQDIAYSTAIDSIGVLANCLSLEDFRSDYLIEYLYPLLESLTYQSRPLIQDHGWRTLKIILDNYYHGSIESLILDNSDYLIDSIGLRLSVVNNFSTALPGLLLLVVKVAGIKLLERNELGDLLTQIFILIDSYHGYSVIVEGFFVVFEELIKQIVHTYLDGGSENDDKPDVSTYKPWGMTQLEQLVTLIDESERIVDPIDGYDSSKEYFKRKPGVPFGDQLEDSDSQELDSDDEDEEEGDNADSDEQWQSSVPKQTYMLVQRIFKYGFLMLSHQSQAVKLRILQSMKHAYPVLCTNYNLVLPLISSNWPILLTLISGLESVTTFQENHSSSHELQNLVIPSLELVQIVLEQEKKAGQKFLGRKFIESWEFLLGHNELLKNTYTESSVSDSRDLVRANRSLSRSRLDPRIIEHYVKYISSGITIYSTMISDTAKYEMMKFCYTLGIPKGLEFPRDLQNILWLIRYEISTGPIIQS